MAIYSTLEGCKPKLRCTDVLDELLYANDMDKNASSEAKLQRAMDQISQSPPISTKKTEVVHQPAPGKPYNEPTITVNGQKKLLKIHLPWKHSF